jgi:carboxynorspermidine decarboxylase
VLHESLLKKNLELLKHVRQTAGIEIILAFKGFSMWSTFDLVRQYLDGATASSLNEARLCFEEMKTPSHTYMAAYIPNEFDEIMQISSHITFNSVSQYAFYIDRVKNFKAHHISVGIRVNPEYSEVETALYNPCAVGSRLGEMVENFDIFNGEMPEGLEGLHFHALCESTSYELEKVLINFEERFGNWLPKLKWVNMGGGHLMTREDYDIEHLVKVLKNFKAKYPNLTVILEPGSAIAWRTGDLVATVLDIVNSRGIKTIMLDVSFTAHMPDTLEMPYRPRIVGAHDPSETTPPSMLFRIGGMSCLSGDYMEAYAFENEPKIGDLIVFEDMIHYTMVKTTTFNGVGHPDISILKPNGKYKIVRRFGYKDFKNRLS